ncbi:MAG TPA: hypothetical protein VM537_07825 [Anaerolineae bacterium]|nr:hypothetical protein [Anaerolineae bacterium]
MKKDAGKIEVELVGTLERTPETVAILVRRAESKPPTAAELKAITTAVTTMFDDGVVIICLGPNEDIRGLNEAEMSARGWVRGLISDDGRTRARRLH